MGEKVSCAHRIRQGLGIRGLTQKDLCDKTGIPKSAMSQYCSGAFTPKQERTALIAQALGVNEAWLMGYDVPMEREPATRTPPGNLLPANVFPIPKFVKKPRLGTIACGKPVLAVEQAEEFDEVPEYIECDFTLKCKGDSMINARIYNGDTVYIRRQGEVENGQIAAVRIGDEATLKRVYYNGQRLILRACNPLYEDLEYEGEALNDIEIMGLAVAFTSMLI